MGAGHEAKKTCLSALNSNKSSFCSSFDYISVKMVRIFFSVIYATIKTNKLSYRQICIVFCTPNKWFLSVCLLFHDLSAVYMCPFYQMQVCAPLFFSIILYIFFFCIRTFISNFKANISLAIRITCNRRTSQFFCSMNRLVFFF